MGIIINDVVDTTYGSSLTGTYLAIATDPLYIQKKEGNFHLVFSTKLWINKEARDSQKKHIAVNLHEITIEPEEINGNVYTIAYNHAKTLYTDFEESL